MTEEKREFTLGPDK